MIGAEVGGRGGADGILWADWLIFWFWWIGFLLAGDSDLREEFILGEAEENEGEGVPLTGEWCWDGRGEGGGGRGGDGGLLSLASGLE